MVVTVGGKAADEKGLTTTATLSAAFSAMSEGKRNVAWVAAQSALPPAPEPATVVTDHNGRPMRRRALFPASVFGRIAATGGGGGGGTCWLYVYCHDTSKLTTRANIPEDESAIPLHEKNVDAVPTPSVNPGATPPAPPATVVTAPITCPATGQQHDIARKRPTRGASMFLVALSTCGTV